MMRWFLVVYVLFCWMLFFSGYFFLKSYHFDGPPYGTFVLARDIAGLDFRSIEELMESSLCLFTDLSFRVRIGDKNYHLKSGRHFFVRVAKERLIAEYRHFCGSVSWYERLKEFIFLTYPRREFPFTYELDRERTRQVIERVFWEEIQFSYRVTEKRELIRKSLTIDVDELINKISASLQPNISRSLDFEMTASEKEEVLSVGNPFPYLFSEEKMTLLTSDRGFAISTDFIRTYESGLFLNPGDSFSLLASAAVLPIQTAYGEQHLELEDIVFTDYYGLSRLGSLLFKSFLKAGFKIIEHGHFSHYLSDQDWFLPGFDVCLSDKQDFKVLNNKNYPLCITFAYENNSLVLKTWLALKSDSRFELLDSARRIIPSYTQSLLDESLEKGEQRIERTAIPGLNLTIRRVEHIPARESRSNVVWQTRYHRRNGIVYVSGDDLNIYDGDWGLIDEEDI